MLGAAVPELGATGPRPHPSLSHFQDPLSQAVQMAPDSSVCLPRGAISVLGRPCPPVAGGLWSQGPQVPAFKGLPFSGGQETRAPRHPQASRGGLGAGVSRQDADPGRRAPLPASTVSCVSLSAEGDLATVLRPS